jgi:hypothetical protein
MFSGWKANMFPFPNNQLNYTDNIRVTEFWIFASCHWILPLLICELQYELSLKTQNISENFSNFKLQSLNKTEM